jgi:hypothetical protein
MIRTGIKDNAKTTRRVFPAFAPCQKSVTEKPALQTARPPAETRRSSGSSCTPAHGRAIRLASPYTAYRNATAFISIFLEI